VKQVTVLVPIYKPALEPLEAYSLARSLRTLAGRDVRFIGPAGLEIGYYTRSFPGVPIIGFEARHFASVPDYNRLLLNADFYRLFADSKFVLILQTDAVVLRDELDYWCAQPFDYIGAPWPDGWELFVSVGRFSGERGKRVKVHVGNGGLSLRRVAKCIALLDEFADGAVEYFSTTGSNEDLFFAFMGSLSSDFILPNEIIASRFAMELKPSYYFAVNGGRLPMGTHAWWKTEPAFWRSHGIGLVENSAGSSSEGGNSR